MKRSGTNYTKWLLQENFRDVRVLSELLGWKHGKHHHDIDWTGKTWADPHHEQSEQERLSLVSMVTDGIRQAAEAGNIRYIATSKNPYAWWSSYLNFLERPEPMIDVRRAVIKWNELHANWLDIPLVCATRLALVVRYEDLLTNLDDTLDHIKSVMSLEKRHKHYIKNDNKMARRSDLNWHMGHTNEKFDASYYTEKKYLNNLDDETMEIFRNFLDKKVMEKLGYEIL